MQQLAALLDDLPEELHRQVFTHASWTDNRGVESYERLAFIGDSVLGLAVTTALLPRLEAARYGPGRLTKIRAQVVSGRTCRHVAERLGVPDRLRETVPPAFRETVEQLTANERVLASIMEAMIGAVYLQHGFDTTAPAVVEAFESEIARALSEPDDYKSRLQERIARRGGSLRYEVIEEEGPPHDRVFEIAVRIDDELLGHGSGRSKKDAEQEAARTALATIGEDG